MVLVRQSRAGEEDTVLFYILYHNDREVCECVREPGFLFKRTVNSLCGYLGCQSKPQIEGFACQEEEREPFEVFLQLQRKPQHLSSTNSSLWHYGGHHRQKATPGDLIGSILLLL